MKVITANRFPYDILCDVDEALVHQIEKEQKRRAAVEEHQLQSGSFEPDSFSWQETFTRWSEKAGWWFLRETAAPYFQSQRDRVITGDQQIRYVMRSLGVAFEGLMAFIGNVQRAETWHDYYRAVTSLCHSVFHRPLWVSDESIFVKTLELLSQLWESSNLDYTSWFSFFTGVESGGNELVLQNGDAPPSHLQRLRDALSHLSDWQNNPILIRLKKIFIFLVSNSVFEYFGVKLNMTDFARAEVEATKLRKQADPVSYLADIIETCIDVFERCFDAVSTRSWAPLVFTARGLGRWIDLVYSIKEDSLKLHNPEATGVCYHEFLQRISDCLEQGDHLVRYAANLSSSEKATVKRLLSEIRLIKAEQLTKKAAQQERRAPFAVCLFGGSGVGKSTLSQIIFNYFGNCFNLPVDDEYRYVRNFSDQYWSAFSTSQWCIQLDDVSARRAELKDDTSLDEILQIINNVPYTSNQADLADKGKTPVKPELVIGTTNRQDLFAHAYYNNPLAILRRFQLHLKVEVKADYGKFGGQMLDQKKIPPLVEGELPDWWDITVYEARVAGNLNNQKAVLARLTKFTDINKFLRFLGETAKDYREKQQQAENNSKAFKQLQVCKNCLTPMKGDNCPCQEPSLQNDEVIISPKVALTIGACAISGWYLYKYRHKFRENVLDPLQEWRERVNLVANTVHNIRMECQYVRTMFKKVGEKLTSARKYGKIAIAVTSALIGLIGVKWLWDQFNALRLQGISAETGGLLSVKDEKPNPWVRDYYEPSSLEVGRRTLSWKNVPVDKIHGLTRGNIVAISASYATPDTTKVRLMRALCIGGNLYVTNLHNIPEVECHMTVTNQTPAQGICANVTFRLSRDDGLSVPERDLFFFTIDCLPPKRVLKDLFVKKGFTTVCKGEIVVRNFDATWTRIETRGCRLASKMVKPLDLEIESWEYESAINTEKGMCGSPLFLHSPSGPIIAGIHQLGGTRNSGSAVAIFREDVDQAIEHFRRPLFSPGRPNLTDLQGKDIPLSPLHHKSVFRYIDSGAANVYGSLLCFRAKHKSSITATIIQPNVLARGYEIKECAPVMSGWQPWRIAAMDIVQQKHNFNISILREAKDGFLDDVKKGLSKKDLAELIILTNAATVNGQPGVKFIDKMNRNTSMGFPWRKKKKMFLTYLGEEDIWPDKVDFDDAFYDRVDEIIDLYRDGQRASPIFVAHLKDEPVSHKKAKMGKTRVFAGAPADWAFVVRKYLLTFVRVFQNNRFLFEGAPGTNAASREWQDFYDFLTEFGVDRIVAGDFKCFDKGMGAILILLAFEFIIGILAYAGWCDEDLMIVWGIAYDTAFAFIDFNGDLVEFFGSNPSGHPITVIINCIVNSIYMRYVWIVAGHKVAEFKIYIHLLTYGDDNIMNVRIGCNFNHTIIQKILGEVGVIYTMPDKESETKPFMHIKEASFLKRYWVYEPELDTHVARLDHDSINKMLTVCVPSPSICAEMQAVEVMHTAVREYFFYGRDTFEEKRTMFIEIVRECDLGAYYFREFPTWEQLKTEYNSQ